MRCSLITLVVQFTLTGILCAAATADAQSIDQVKVDLQLNQASLQQSLLTLQSKSGVLISFADQVLARETKKVTLDVRNVSVRQAIHRILSQTRLTYRQEKDYVIIDLKPVPPKPGIISGKVVDEKNTPMQGASVKIVGAGKAISTGIDGGYIISLEPGTYSIEVSFMGYQTRRITGIVVSEGKNISLDVVMKIAPKALGQVVVTATFQAASVEGLYNRQKNSAHITDGMSAAQIGRTPDINVAQVLNRISGVTTVNNKYVVVRGLSERYNQAMIDGIVLPSTNMNRRNFSFDVVPQELVSSVVVNKTATPDMSSEFSGGQVIMNTVDIPTENFTSVSIGTGYNSQSTGKDFLMAGGRGKYDYLGFDDGRRKEPPGLISWAWQNDYTPPPGRPGNDLPNIPGGSIPYSSFDAVEQSKRLSNEGYKMARYIAAPDQQYRFALGRVYHVNDSLRFGFSGGVTYRNQQRIVEFNNVRSQLGGYNYMDSAENGGGRSYRFNTTMGAALNMALEGKKFKLALKNMYSRIFDDNFNEAYRLQYNNDLNTKFHEMFEDPQVTSVWQTKLEAEHRLASNGLKLEYTAAVTHIGQQVMDQRRIRYTRNLQFGGKDYFQLPGFSSPGNMADAENLDGRLWAPVKETDYNWGFSLSQPFNFLGDKSTAKIGYAGWDKHRTLAITRMIPFTVGAAGDLNQSYETLLDPANMGPGAFYWAEMLNGPTFEGQMNGHALYGMLDQRFFHKLRAIYGVRVEYYNLANRQEDYIKRRFAEIPDAFKLFTTLGEKNWRALPSVNLIYSLTSKMNIRAAYSKTAIRPDFRETAYFGFYDYELDGNITGRQVVSTLVDNVDLRYEWYPTPGEVFSVSGFYKNLDQPIELVNAGNAGFYRFQNQHRAVNYGLEMEFRKSLGFIANRQWLRNITIFGNGTLIKSKVEIQRLPMPGENVDSLRLPGQDRPLYGQSPWLINAGISYQAEIIGFTASYNRYGPRTYTTHENPNFVEYENGRNMLDIQLNARLLKKKAEVKLNLSNLFNEYSLFYQNEKAYEQIDPRDGTKGTKLVNGTNAYEKGKGDRVNYRSRNGRTASVSITYRF